MTDAKLEEFKTETENDSALQTVKKYILEGWPEKSSTVDPLAQSYYRYCNEISYAEGLLLKGNCVIVPSSMRKDIRTEFIKDTSVLCDADQELDELFFGRECQLKLRI